MNSKKEPWKIAVLILAFAAIIFMIVRKDVSDILAGSSGTDALWSAVSVVFTATLKIGLTIGMVWFIRWTIMKARNKE